MATIEGHASVYVPGAGAGAGQSSRIYIPFGGASQLAGWGYAFLTDYDDAGWVTTYGAVSVAGNLDNAAVVFNVPAGRYRLLAGLGPKVNAAAGSPPLAAFVTDNNWSAIHGFNAVAFPSRWSGAANVLTGPVVFAWEGVLPVADVIGVYTSSLYATQPDALAYGAYVTMTKIR